MTLYLRTLSINNFVYFVFLAAHAWPMTIVRVSGKTVAAGIFMRAALWLLVGNNVTQAAPRVRLTAVGIYRDAAGRLSWPRFSAKQNSTVVECSSRQLLLAITPSPPRPLACFAPMTEQRSLSLACRFKYRALVSCKT